LSLKKSAAFADLVNDEWGINKNEAYECWRDFAGTSRRFKFDYFYEKKFNKKLNDRAYQLIEPKLSNLLKRAITKGQVIARSIRVT